MALGLLFAGISGGGQALGEALQKEQAVNDEKELMQQRAALEEERAKRLAEFQHNLQFGGIQRAGQYLNQADQTTPQSQAKDITPTATAPVAQPEPKLQPTGDEDIRNKIAAITVNTESSGNPNAVGPNVPGQGTPKGLYQVMDATNANPGYGVTPAQDTSAEERARVGRDYLNAMLDKYNGDPAKAWAAYNAGPGRVDDAIKNGGDNWLAQLPPETQNYVGKNVTALQGQFGAREKTAIPEFGTGAQNAVEAAQTQLESAKGKAPPRDSEVFQLAMRKALQAGDGEAYEQLQRLAKERFVPAGYNGVVDPLTGEVFGQTRAQTAEIRGDIQAKKDAAAMERLKLTLNSRENLVKNKQVYESTLTPEDKATAQAIASGQLPPISGNASRNPKNRLIMAEVLQQNPNYTAQDYANASAAQKKFFGGKNGDMIRSFNVSISHLDTLSNLADALQNNDIPLINKFANMWEQQTGQPAPTEFNAAKKIVGDELVKAIVGSGGALGDRESMEKTLDASNSPAQLKGVVGTYQELMAGQLAGLSKQYESTTGRQDFGRFLTDEAKDLFAHTDVGRKAVATIGTGGNVSAAGGLARVSTDADYNALPSGSTFIGPDGKTRRKP